MWDHVFGERVTTPLENRLAIRGCDRLARNAKRQTGDEQSAKRVSGNVDTLPVGRSTDQNRPSRMPEFLEQNVAAVFSVNQQRTVVHCAARTKLERGLSHVAVA